MIIDKKLSIITYLGLQPLNLMVKDTDIASDPIKSNEWDKMIDSIDTIYATQDNNNNLPVFWTRRFTATDRFGNLVYKYAPNPQSTLRFLSSRSAYYIILRDANLAPLKIPANGGLASGEREDLPLVSPPLADFVLNKDSFEYSFKPQIINLIPYNSYDYSWKVVTSNWPVVASPLSGTLKPASPTGTINSTITFCPTTGVCSDKTLPYILPTNCSLESNQNPFITLQLSVKSQTGTESLGDPFTLTCDDCLPRARIDISGIGPNTVVEPIEDQGETPSYSFQLNFNNLELDKQYSYQIETLRADWPIVYVTPISGSFLNKISNTAPIDNKFYFCPSTGLCPPNNSTIPAYSIPNYPKFLTNEAEYNIFIRVSLAVDSSCAGSSTIYSDVHSVRYKKL